LDIKSGLALKSISITHYEGVTTVINNGEEMKMPMKIDGQSETIMSK
jgi:hypothetical protein